MSGRWRHFLSLAWRLRRSASTNGACDEVLQQTPELAGNAAAARGASVL
jgi:hypothetical protein